MIRNKATRMHSRTRAQSNRNQNTAATRLAGFIQRITGRSKPNIFELQTVFTGRNKQGIIDLIDISHMSNRKRENIGAELVVLLTDLFLLYKRQGLVVITPSLYLQYLDFEVIENLVATHPQDKETALILAYIRALMYDITKQSLEETTEAEKVSPKTLFFAGTLVAVTRLKHLEALKVPSKIINGFGAQKSGNTRIAHANYRYAKIGKGQIIDIRNNDEFDLTYRYLRKSTFQGAVGSINAQYTVFEDCVLDSANFHHSYFEWTKFINTSINHTKFSDSKFFDLDFKELKGSESAVFINCRFCLCKMSECKAIFIDCDFDDCENEGLRLINKGKEYIVKTKNLSIKEEVENAYLTDMRNLFVRGRSGILIETLSGMVEDKCGNREMVNGRVFAFISAITKPLCYLRDRGYIELSVESYIEYMSLDKIEELLFKHDGKYGADFDELLSPLLANIKSIPDYDTSRIDEGQSEATNEQFGFIAMQVIKVINHLKLTEDATNEQEGFIAMQSDKTA